MKLLPFHIAVFSVVLAGTTLAHPTFGNPFNDVSEPGEPVTPRLDPASRVLGKRDDDCAPDQPSLNCRTLYDNQRGLIDIQLGPLVVISNDFVKYRSDANPTGTKIIQALYNNRNSDQNALSEDLANYVEELEKLQEQLKKLPTSYLTASAKVLSLGSKYEESIDEAKTSITTQIWEVKNKLRDITGQKLYTKRLTLRIIASYAQPPGEDEVSLRQKLIATQEVKPWNDLVAAVKAASTTYKIIAQSTRRQLHLG